MHQYGLIGNPLSHSFSKNYFENKFKQERITDAQYDLFPLDSIDELIPLIQQTPSLSGLNVTIPYKETIIPFLDEVDPVAQLIGAVNTISIENKAGRKYLKGYNTDAIGFQKSIKPFLAMQHSRALILGNGGASKAIAYVLKQLDMPFYTVSRSPKDNSQVITYDDLDAKAIEQFPLLINTTPLGMHPQEHKLPPIALEGIGKNHLVYDLIYNPEETLLLKAAKKRGALCVNGLSMLKLQAEAAWEIWRADF